MRDDLPNKISDKETAVVNLDSVEGDGTHWVCYSKNGKTVIYFDSFGNLRPPPELIDYFGKSVNVFYNYTNKQKVNTSNCGHLCLEFLTDRKYY